MSDPSNGTPRYLGSGRRAAFRYSQGCGHVVLAEMVWERTQKLAILKQKVILKRNMKKVWERRSHAFPSTTPLIVVVGS